jgi:hypothetical protein
VGNPSCSVARIHRTAERLASLKLSIASVRYPYATGAMLDSSTSSRTGIGFCEVGTLVSCNTYVWRPLAYSAYSWETEEWPGCVGVMYQMRPDGEKPGPL